MSGVALLRPEWLLALPVAAALALLVRRRAGRPGAWARAIDPALMAAMRRIGRIEARGAGWARLLPLAAAGLIVLALSGPAVERREARAFYNLDGAVLVVDASPSMVEDAAWRQALTAGRVAVAALGSKPGALVVYAGDAYVAAPLTTDTRQIGLTLSLIEPGTVPDPGSRPARGLLRAADLLDESRIIAGDVVLFTDGGGLGGEAMAAARRLADLGARLLVVRVATAEAGEAAPLQSLAAQAGGRVFAADEADALAAALAPRGAARLGRQEFRLLFQVDLGRYLLLLALLPLLGLFRRRPA